MIGWFLGPKVIHRKTRWNLLINLSFYLIDFYIIKSLFLITLIFIIQLYFFYILLDILRGNKLNLWAWKNKLNTKISLFFYKTFSNLASYLRCPTTAVYIWINWSISGFLYINICQIKIWSINHILSMGNLFVMYGRCFIYIYKDLSSGSL